jgi:hypothetical protein
MGSATWENMQVRIHRGSWIEEENIVPCSGYFLRTTFPPGAIVSSLLLLQRQMGKGLKLWVVDLRRWRRGGEDLGCRWGGRWNGGGKIWDGEERSRREGRDRGGGNLSISVEGLVRLPTYPIIMVVIEKGSIGKGESKRTFNICFAQASEILNIWIARQFVPGLVSAIYWRQRMILLSRYYYIGYSFIRNY